MSQRKEPVIPNDLLDRLLAGENSRSDSQPWRQAPPGPSPLSRMAKS